MFVSVTIFSVTDFLTPRLNPSRNFLIKKRNTILYLEHFQNVRTTRFFKKKKNSIECEGLRCILRRNFKLYLCFLNFHPKISPKCTKSNICISTCSDNFSNSTLPCIFVAKRNNLPNSPPLLLN